MRILVIEDDEAINRALKLILKREGYAVDAFTDPMKGSKQILTNSSDYDLAVFDIMMPGRSGVNICEELRRKGIAVPVMMLTALSNAKDKVRALDAGADDYLTKPFSAEELLARIRALLRRPRNTLPPTISHGKLTLVTSDKKLLSDGTEIPLTLKEFRILEYLLRHPGQTLTRDQLLDHAWDAGMSSFSNTVEVHINSLRKKLKRYGITNLIKTVHGVGYKVIPT